ncbi:MAG: sensor domain-containing diguanylate cyclase [Actinobacteria bacterium]|nr:sensor domain-containing diguanylate cyclase [Actinomycetota bacterium]
MGVIQAAERKDDLCDIIKRSVGFLDEGILFVDKRGILGFCNPAAAKICMKTGSCHVGEPFFTQCKPPIAKKLHPLFHELTADPARHLSTAGEIDNLSFEADCRSIPDETGGFAGMAVIVRNVTERHRVMKLAKHFASIDSLTRLFNRRHFHIKLRDEAMRARRQGYPLGLIILDIDNFKEVNDRFGHLKGDAALRGVGATICRNIRRDVDIACRYGGDEFAIILPEADLDQAAEVARRIREDISSVEPPITVSGGVAELDEHNPESLIHIADRAMYRAKSLGGDLIFVEHEKQGV